MRKVKLYLDTSVISHLIAEDVPEKMKDTLLLWEELKLKKYEIIVSNITISEISRCPEPKKTIMFDLLSETEYSLVEENDESLNLTEYYIKFGVLKEKSRDDCRHISVATIEECKYIASWNFKHFVNVAIIEKVQAVNKMFGYHEINIVPPSMLIGGEENDN